MRGAAEIGDHGNWTRGKRGAARRAKRAAPGEGAVGPTLCVPRVFRFALQGSGGKAVTHSSGKLDHGGFAEQNGADAIQMFDDGGVVIENLRGVRFREIGRASCRERV